jgi:colicin import membrane protein
VAVNPNPPATDPQPNPQPAPAAGPTNTDTQAPTGEPSIPKSRFDEVNNELKRLKKAEEDRQKAADKAAEDRAKEQGEWEKVARQHETKAAELEPFKVKAERYEAALTAMLETQRKDLPAHITALLDKLDPAEQLEWIAANREALGTSATAANGTNGAPRGTPTAPKPAGSQSQAEATKSAREALVGNPRYGQL